MATKRSKITVQGTEIGIEHINGKEFLSLTDIVRTQESDYVLYSWLKNHDTIDFLALWESQNNPQFLMPGFQEIKARLHEKRFTLSPAKWSKATRETVPPS